MFYTIYKVTNELDGKIYIGKHQTKDLNDGYMGSGKLITRAIEKYGVENFMKEILYSFETEEEMNAKEAELVSEEFVKEDTNYNLCPGGKGGWGYNNTKEGQKLREFSYVRRARAGGKKFAERLKSDKDFREQRKLISKKAGKKAIEILKQKYPKGTFYGRNHTEEFKERIGKITSEYQRGGGNSQYGTVWITNGLESKKIKKAETIPEGWCKGRVIKKRVD